MKHILILFGRLLLVIFLTVISQIGGVVLLISWLISRAFRGNAYRAWREFGVFVILYALISIFMLPPLAKKWGKEPLPLWASKEIPVQPTSWLSPVFNRHYVSISLKTAVKSVADQLAKEYPNTRISYLDANFPLLKSFPLLPHLSHHDGRKLDVSFFYLDSEGKQTNKKPSVSGYGIFEAPRLKEGNTSKHCINQGYFQYDYPKYLTFGSSSGYQFDSKRTKRMVQLFVQNAKVNKAFIEPHLKQRLGLDNYHKIRFHGCQSVRHDDHLHIQL